MTRRIERDTIYRCRRFSAETIELCVRWYTTYRLSYRDLAAMMAEREVIVAHTTIMRGVLQYVPEYERRWSRFARAPGSSWRMDESCAEIIQGLLLLQRSPAIIWLLDTPSRSAQLPNAPSRFIGSARFVEQLDRA